MGLDLSGLNKLGKDAQAFRTASEQSEEGLRISVAQNKEKPSEAESVRYPLLQAKADHNKYLMQQAADVYAKYQENIKKAEELKSQLLKGCKAGEDMTVLFLKAAECIGLMTGEEHFIVQIKASLKQ